MCFLSPLMRARRKILKINLILIKKVNPLKFQHAHPGLLMLVVVCVLHALLDGGLQHALLDGGLQHALQPVVAVQLQWMFGDGC
ncbi:unnamed protein product [Meloidogyne enterolobii]|uniref:Uncharacterized protein n=1 Tax=Meloidogyne enterolobii TaxID=390850 RepID=A0ACB0Y1R2_MELEN